MWVYFFSVSKDILIILYILADVFSGLDSEEIIGDLAYFVSSSKEKLLTKAENREAELNQVKGQIIEFNASKLAEAKVANLENENLILKNQIQEIEEINVNQKKELADKIIEIEKSVIEIKNVKDRNTDLENRNLILKDEVNKAADVDIENKHLLNKVNKLENQNSYLRNKVEYCNKQKKMSQRKVRRLTQKLKSVSEIVKDLKDKKFINKEGEDVLKSCSPSIAELIKRVGAKCENNGKRNTTPFSPELKSFAIVLLSYSKHGYYYLRKSFNTCLPDPATVRKWVSKVRVNSGFNSQAFSSIKHKCDNSKTPILVNIVQDEMAIRQHLEWDSKNKNWVGFADVYSDSSKSRPLAKEAINFLVVGVNQRWKINVGHFFINGLNATKRAELMKQCIMKLQMTGVRISSITFDGLSANLSMAEKLGAKINVRQNDLLTNTELPLPWFPNPGNPRANICVVCDPSHVLKLLRNCFGHKEKYLMDGNNGIIYWFYIKRLLDFQHKIGLHLRNKLTLEHVFFRKRIMKVKLAAQVLSNSVADALQYLLEQNIPDFQGCEPTIKFIRTINSVFDILNSRSLLHFGLKRPLNDSNFDNVCDVLDKTYDYIKQLKIISGDKVELVCASSCENHTGFLGLLISIKSILYIYSAHVKRAIPKYMSYLPTYKLSQDHLELEFAVYRSLLGANNNPTCRQFNSAVTKRLLQKDTNYLALNQSNCSVLESMEVLNIEEPASNHIVSNAVESDLSIITDNLKTLCKTGKDIVEYIGGSCIRTILKSISCEACQDELIDHDRQPDTNTFIKFVERHNGLHYPSQSVNKALEYTEMVYMNYVCESDTSYKTVKIDIKFDELVHFIITHLLYDEDIVFNDQKLNWNSEKHDNDHKEVLLKCLVTNYLTLRLHHTSKQYNVNIKNSSRKSRQQLVKFILFNSL